MGDMADHITENEIADNNYNIITYPEQVETVIPASNVLDNPYTGIAQAPFSPEAAEILMATIPDSDIEIRPDGLIYLPEIKYRRILNKAFGPGAWSLLPKEIMVGNGDNMMYYRGQLFVHGRFVSEAIGEQQYYPSNDRMSYATAAESAKSNCLVRCCKDLGIAGDLWDPSFVRRWIAEYAVGVWCENIGSNPKDKGKKRIMWRKKLSPKIDIYPWKEDGPMIDGSMASGAKQQSARQLPAVSYERFEKDRPVGNEATGNNPAVITIRQAKRFRAIANEFGWTLDQMGSLLKSQGYADPESIRRSEYDRLCAALEDPEIRASHRPSPRTGAAKP